MARKKKVKINPLVFKITAVFILSFVVGIGIYKVVTFFLTRSNYFSVKGVVIDPALSFIEKRDTSWIKKKNIFQIDLKEAKRKLEFRYPQIDNLKVTRNFPDQICIKAEKRKPIAQIRINEKVLTLDSKAIVLSTKSRQEGSLPFIIGVKGKRLRYSLGAALNSREVKAALNIIKAFKETSDLNLYSISEVDVSTLSKIEFLLNNKIKIILDRDKIERKVEVLGIILSQGRLNLDQVKYIDLRFKEPIVGKK